MMTEQPEERIALTDEDRIAAVENFLEVALRNLEAEMDTEILQARQLQLVELFQETGIAHSYSFPEIWMAGYSVALKGALLMKEQYEAGLRMHNAVSAITADGLNAGQLIESLKKEIPNG